MTHDAELEHDVLRRARSAFSPSREDGERVRAAVTKQLALSPLAPLGDETGAATDEIGRSFGQWLPRLAVAAAVAAGGGAGYFLGHEAGMEAGRAQGLRESKALVEPLARRHEEHAEAYPMPPASTVIVEQPLPRAPASQRSAAPAPSGEDVGLADEVRLLRRVERALRDHNPRYALALLGELDRTVPRGQLAEERQAARVMARCQFEGGSLALAKQFSDDHPKSAYVARVAETCSEGTEQRIPEGAETNP